MSSMRRYDKKKLMILSVIFIVLLVAGLTGFPGNNVLRYGFRIFLYITIGEMWNLLSGYAGMTSLGQQAFIGLAGYALAVATTMYHLPYAMGFLIGLVISLAFATLLSLLLLRIRGMYFAITTWVVAEALGTLFLGMSYVNRGAGVTITAVPYPRIGTLYVMALILCVLSLISVRLLLDSGLGLGIMAMRDDPEAAEALGVNVIRNKRLVYIIAALFTSLAGSLFFLNKGTIYPESGFDIGWTIAMVFIVIIGGVGTIKGPVRGAVIYVLLSEFLAHYPGWSNIILGVIVVASGPVKKLIKQGKLPKPAASCKDKTY